MGTASALSHWNVHSHNSDNNYSLLDSAASVHVFHNKDKFTHFKRATRGQGLLCGTEVIMIEGWGEISLPLRIGNQTSILILKDVAYVPNFPLNLVSLGCLEDKGYRWHHWSGEIRNKNTSRIIGSTSRQGNNYKIGNFETGIGTALVTLAIRPQSRYIIGHDDKKKGQMAPMISTFSSMIVDKEAARSYNQLHAVASPDIWHRRMGHIGPLGLYKLGKECLGVRLRGKKMSQCPHCALSKISQQISRRSPANKATRPFYRVFVDWLDLEEGWDSYQGDGAIVRRVMVVICEATGMAITYFTQSAKEDENLPLMQDFVTWLVLRYNLEVKVIRSDNEMNRIKTKEWCNNVGISFEPCAPDTHAQSWMRQLFILRYLNERPRR